MTPWHGQLWKPQFPEDPLLLRVDLLPWRRVCFRLLPSKSCDIFISRSLSSNGSARYNTMTTATAGIAQVI
jgi:hypothetical protein